MAGGKKKVCERQGSDWGSKEGRRKDGQGSAIF